MIQYESKLEKLNKFEFSNRFPYESIIGYKTWLYDELNDININNNNNNMLTLNDIGHFNVNTLEFESQCIDRRRFVCFVLCVVIFGVIWITFVERGKKVYWCCELCTKDISSNTTHIRLSLWFNVLYNIFVWEALLHFYLLIPKRWCFVLQITLWYVIYIVCDVLAEDCSCYNVHI